MELEINNVKYRTGKLTAMEQFHVMRRLAPLLSGLGESLAKLPVPNGNDTAPEDSELWTAIGPVADVLAKMSDNDTEYVLKHCLAKVTRFNGQGWGQIMAGGNIMFEDEIDLSAMMQLTISTIQENLASFFPAAPVNNSVADSTPPSTSSQ